VRFEDRSRAGGKVSNFLPAEKEERVRKEKSGNLLAAGCTTSREQWMRSQELTMEPVERGENMNKKKKLDFGVWGESSENT